MNVLTSVLDKLPFCGHNKEPEHRVVFTAPPAHPKRTYRCSHCGATGHNIKTCPERK